ncbi:MAG: hypothetical protein WC312_08410, partial [Candidatus Omnitrophota bacterium]
DKKYADISPAEFDADAIFIVRKELIRMQKEEIGGVEELIKGLNMDGVCKEEIKKIYPAIKNFYHAKLSPLWADMMPAEVYNYAAQHFFLENLIKPMAWTPWYEGGETLKYLKESRSIMQNFLDEVIFFSNKEKAREFAKTKWLNSDDKNRRAFANIVLDDNGKFWNVSEAILKEYCDFIQSETAKLDQIIAYLETRNLSSSAVSGLNSNPSLRRQL